MKSRILSLITMVTGFCLLLAFGFVFINKAAEREFPHGYFVPAHLVAKDKSEEPIQPIVSDDTLDSNEVALGNELFHDVHLSKNNTVSCASCHDLAKGGTDARPVSVGIYQRTGTRNAPTVFNCSLNYRQFWDGRASSLSDQIDGPIRSVNEMHSNWLEVVNKLQQDEHYVKAFSSLYADGLQPDNIKKALTVFERSLTTPGSRFDQYLKGDRKALTVGEKAGYRLFIASGCISCHQGVNIGGNMMQPFGIMDNSYTHYSTQKNGRLSDQSRLIVSNVSEGSPLFKVPSLRNIARTAPYFHNGSASSLHTAVEIMGHSQLGRDFSREEVNSLVEFLNALTGKYRGKNL